MQFFSVLALAASMLSVEAASHLHNRFHARDLSKRATVVLNSKISTLAAAPNANVAYPAVGSMPYQNTIVNNATEDAKVLFWEDMGFATILTAYNPNPPAPSLILDLPAGESRVVSFSNSYSGAYAAVFPETNIQIGGGPDTAWVELTSGQYGVVDVSFLPNMASKWTSVTSGECVSDWTTCSYKCNDGSTTCYEAGNSELYACSGPKTSWQYDAGPNGAGPWNGGCNLASRFTTTFAQAS